MEKRRLTVGLIVALIVCASAIVLVRAAPQAAGVILDPDGTQEARPGEHLVYDHTLTNTGTTTDTFSVEVASTQGWPVGLLSEAYPTETQVLTLELGPQISTALLVSLTVPSDAGGMTEVTVVTATSQIDPAVYDTAVDTTHVQATVYLPLVARRWPPIPDVPVLNPIYNSDGDGYYTVDWEPAYLAETYVLQEDDNAAFSSPTQRYDDSGTYWSATGKGPGTYYYRVKARNTWGDSGWSVVRQVTVVPPRAEVYVENNTGGTLCYEVYGTGIGERCYSSGTHFYGSFPSGTYTYRASAWCGSIEESKYFPAGEVTHQFWCQ